MPLTEKLRKRHTNLQVQIEYAKERLKMKEEYTVKLNQITALKAVIKAEIEVYKKARYITNKLQTNKKEQDEIAIKNSLEVACSLVLKGNDSVPYFSTRSGAYPETELMIKLGDRIIPLAEAEGTGFNESVSMVSIASVLSATHYTKFLFFDELFSSVSPENTENLSNSFNDMFDDKFQVVIVEQKDEVVRNASYREFRINIIDGVSYVTTYDVDKEGNKTLVEV